MKVTVLEAIEMLALAGVDIAAELTNIPAAYIDIVDDIERDGDEVDFSMAEFEEAMKVAERGNPV